MRAGVVAPVIGLAAIVAGCGSSQPATARPDVAGVVFPSSAGDRQARTVAAAREQLIRRCMAARGFTYPPATPPHLGAAYRRALLGSPRAVETLQVAGGLTVTYRRAGCHAQALGALYGSVRRYQRLVAEHNALSGEAGGRVAADPRLKRAVAGWRRCMSARGFRYPSPDAVRQAVHRPHLQASDRACARRAALYPALARAQREALRHLSGAGRAAAATLARSRAGALARARRILSGAGRSAAG